MDRRHHKPRLWVVLSREVRGRKAADRRRASDDVRARVWSASRPRRSPNRRRSQMPQSLVYQPGVFRGGAGTGERRTWDLPGGFERAAHALSEGPRVHPGQYICVASRESIDAVLSCVSPISEQISVDNVSTIRIVDPVIGYGFQGLRFTSFGPLNEDLGRVMSAVLKRQLHRSPRYFVGFHMGAKIVSRV